MSQGLASSQSRNTDGEYPGARGMSRRPCPLAGESCTVRGLVASAPFLTLLVEGGLELDDAEASPALLPVEATLVAVEPAMWEIAEEVLHVATVLSALRDRRMLSHEISFQGIRGRMEPGVRSQMA
jgi:hypothetical protein